MKALARKENNPNPARLIQSLRHLGYDNYGAICDLIDNCIDANAKNIIVKIGWEQKDFTISIADDGCGMDNNILDQAVRLGSLTDRDPNSDLGKFGMGLSTASLSLARRTEVYTKAKDGDTLKSIIDVDDIIKSNAFEKEEGLATNDDIKLFKEVLGHASSGTIVVLRKCDNVKNDNVTIFSNTLRREVGRIFRLFIVSGRNIIINSVKADPIDPLMLETSGTEILCDEDFQVKLELAGKVLEDVVSIKIARLPEYTQEENREKGINIRNQGFYIMRNQREIASGVALDGMFVKHNDYNRFRAEVYFSGLLDDLVGVNFTKKEVHFNKMLWDKINAIAAGHIREIKRRVVGERVKNDSANVKHEESVRQISKKAKLLVTPPPEAKPMTDKEKKEKNKKLKEVVSTPRDDMERIVSRCRFEQATLGRLGPIYNSFPEGRKLVVQLNIEHPFYERFYLWSQDNPDLQRGIDFLIYSMASAEMTVLSGRDDDTLEMMENLKAIMSNNLRILLS